MTETEELKMLRQWRDQVIEAAGISQDEWKNYKCHPGDILGNLRACRCFHGRLRDLACNNTVVHAHIARARHAINNDPGCARFQVRESMVDMIATLVETNDAAVKAAVDLLKQSAPTYILPT